MTVLRVSNLSKTYQTTHGPVHALRDVSLEVARGECLAVVGESGSGKTTLANMILGILVPTSGALTFDGRPLGAKPVCLHNLLPASHCQRSHRLQMATAIRAHRAARAEPVKILSEQPPVARRLALRLRQAVHNRPRR